ncbi:MAG TPA: hypothetical protein VFW75_16360 [Acetobacteraceae bacterium]|nr:hypothetical protein [Acetobacteraceae bacterium]
MAQTFGIDPRDYGPQALGANPGSGAAPGGPSKDGGSKPPAKSKPKQAKSKPKQPEPEIPTTGPLTEAQYDAWLKAHPKAPQVQVGPWNGPYIYNKYTGQYLESRGYFFSGRMNMGAGGYNEVWLNNAGEGAEYRVYRGPDWPAATAPPTQTPPKCAEGDADELLKMTLESIRDDLSEDNDRQAEASRLKEQMDRMNILSDEFRTAYDRYVDLLEEGQRRVQEQLDAVADARASLLDMCADVKDIDTGRNDLEELQNWFDVTRGLLDMEGRKPIKVDVK